MLATASIIAITLILLPTSEVFVLPFRFVVRFPPFTKSHLIFIVLVLTMSFRSRATVTLLDYKKVNNLDVGSE